MGSNITTKKRKNIDLSEDVMRNLSIKAAMRGKSLKSYIENILIEESVLRDEDMYEYLSLNRPEGKVALREEEQRDFEKWMENES